MVELLVALGLMIALVAVRAVVMRKRAGRKDYRTREQRASTERPDRVGLFGPARHHHGSGWGGAAGGYSSGDSGGGDFGGGDSGGGDAGGGGDGGGGGE